MRDHREISVAKPNGVFRIAVVGDSFVEAMQVAENEGIVQQLEACLNERPGSPVEVLNFGCSGFSSTLELIQVRNWVRSFSPDLVVCLHHFSDISEDWGAASRVVCEGEQRIAVPGPQAVVEPKIRQVLECSQLYRVGVGAFNDRRRGIADRSASLKTSFDAIVHDPYTCEDEEAWRNSLAALTQMHECLKADGIQMVVAIIPIGTQVEPVGEEIAGRTGFQFMAQGRRFEYRGYQQRVTAYCREHAIRVLDLLDAFRAANPEGRTHLYLPHDQHWTAAGHALAAGRIADELKILTGTASP
jgi:hypothetical protein